MKQLKFTDELSRKILDGTKTSTWRLFDDKDLQVGDMLALVNSETNEEFAQGKIIGVYEKQLGDIEEKDFDGHEKFESLEDMLETYKRYYGDAVTFESMVKIVAFELV